MESKKDPGTDPNGLEPDKTTWVLTYRINDVPYIEGFDSINQCMIRYNTLVGRGEQVSIHEKLNDY